MHIKLENIYKKFLHFKHFVINIENMKYSNTSSKIKKIIKLLILTTENFHISHSSLWSSNLSFYAIFSFIPILAIIMSIAGFFGFKELIVNSLFNLLPINPEVYKYILSFTDVVINSTKEGVVTIVALVSLIWAIIKIFSLIEYSFNAIWKVESSRNIFRKITDYTSIVILFPIAVIFSNLLSSTISEKFTHLSANAGFLVSFLLNLLRFSHVFTLCILLGVIYMIIPHTKVKFQYALLSGTFASILIFMLQYLFFKFQRFLINYDAIYGSFAILPVFLLWQRFFWSIMLLGCHLNFISQNYYKYDYSLSPIKLSFYEKKLISLMIMYIYIKNFDTEKEKLSTELIAHKLKISINLTQNLIDYLVKINLLNKIYLENDSFCYQPAFDIEKMDIKIISERLENSGINHLLEFDDNDEYKTIYEAFQNLIKTHENKKLMDL